MPHESDDSPRAQLHNGHGEQIEQAKVDPFGVAIAAFLVTELRSAFELGFMILLPFLIIDLLVTNILVLLGIEQLSHFVVAVPLKLLLFVVVDGWALIAERLVASYL